MPGSRGKRRPAKAGGREIRKTLFNDEWWFSVVDVVAALTGGREKTAKSLEMHISCHPGQITGVERPEGNFALTNKFLCMASCECLFC